MLDETRQSELLALLAWWREAGVDAALDDVPIDWTARGDRALAADFAWPDVRQTSADPTAPAATLRPDPPMPRAPLAQHGAASGQSRSPAPVQPPAENRPPAPSAPTRMMPAPPASGAAMAAREAARTAKTLAELESVLRRFDGCPLKATAKNLCFFRGNPAGRLMVVGEAPGREEDLEGKPFVGRAGQLLDRMLAAIDLGENDVHITNVVYWRPPGNRTPTLEEVQICQPFLERQIGLVEPDIILTLGGPAAKAILGVTDGILRVRGHWGEIGVGDRKFRVMPTLHPAYLLRTPVAKRQAWRDLLAVKLALDERAKGNMR